MRRIRSNYPGSIIGWQEIDDDDEAQEYRILNRVFNKTFITVGRGQRVPITFSRAYKVLNSKVTFGSHGIAKVTPHRVVVEVMLKDRLRFWRPAFAVVNTHYPSGAFNGKVDYKEGARVDAWHDLFKVHQARVKHYADREVTVFWTGDTNRRDMPKVHPRERQLVTAGIDSISVVPGAAKFKIGKTGFLSLNSDHDARYVNIYFSGRRPPKR
jgi:hypothetical protein